MNSTSSLTNYQIIFSIGASTWWEIFGWCLNCRVYVWFTVYCYHAHPYPHSVADQVFCWMTHRVTHLSWERRSFFFPNTITELTIIATLGWKCQHICVSLALLGSACQHLIDVSACTGPRQPQMSIFIHACTWKKPQLHNRIACTVAMAAEWDPPYFVLLH